MSSALSDLLKEDHNYFIVASRGMLCGAGQNFEEESTAGSVDRAYTLTQLSEHFDFACQEDSGLFCFQCPHQNET
jgi:hypothetical protein